MPSKTFNLLANRIPILAMVNERSEIARLIDEYKTGMYFTENELTATVNKLVSVSAAEHKIFASNAINCSKDFTSQLAYKFVDNWILENVPQHS